MFRNKWTIVISRFGGHIWKIQVTQSSNINSISTTKLIDPRSLDIVAKIVKNQVSYGHFPYLCAILDFLSSSSMPKGHPVDSWSKSIPESKSAENNYTPNCAQPSGDYCWLSQTKVYDMISHEWIVSFLYWRGYYFLPRTF